MRNLSKSKIIAFRQCPKRLWLEIHKPELRDDSASEMVFGIGNQVGEIARSIYDPENTGTTIDIGELGHTEALARSAMLLAEGNGPIFEAGLTIEGALAYADVMLPDRSDGTLRWKMIEVKSAASLKDYHRDDIALQSLLAALSGVALTSVSVAHIDSRFVYQGDGDYQGLLYEVDLTDEAQSCHDEASQWIEQAHAVVALENEPEAATGPQCNYPYTCSFCEYCNRDLVFPEFPLSSLPNLHWARRARIEEGGHDDLRNVPDHFLNDKQALVKKCTVTGEPYFDAEGAAADLAPYGFPVWFLDFETVKFTVPIWKDTRPFQQLPFQFSLHRLEADGTLEHIPFLDLSGGDPSEAFTQALVSACGSEGPVYVYSATFENRIMRAMADRFPEHAPALQAIIGRVVDLLPIARKRYYHPSQHGSWSLKAVLPALCPELSYDDLDGVQDGNMAVNAYQEAIAPETTDERKAQIGIQLHEYCKLDTFAMVRIWKIFRGS